MKATLFVIPGSHPALAGRLMLERKGIAYRRVDLVPAAHKAIVRAAGFPRQTVPALKLDGRRVQGTREIALALDAAVPEPPLVPAEPERRTAVLDAERWGDEALQPIPRRLSWWSLRRDRSPMASFAQGARLGLPVGLAVRTAGPFVALSARFNQATDDNLRRDMAELPGIVDRVDELIAEGVIGQAEPNLADYQIATSIRLLMAFEQLRPGLEGRPAGELALRVVPDYPGAVGPVLPADLVPDLAPAAAAS